MLGKYPDELGTDKAHVYGQGSSHCSPLNAKAPRNPKADDLTIILEESKTLTFHLHGVNVQDEASSKALPQREVQNSRDMEK